MTLLLGNAMSEKNASFKLFIFGQEEKGINGACYKAVIPTETDTRLAELKHTCSETHYRTGTRQHHFTRAVDRKAGELMGEYQRKADRMDTLLGEGGDYDTMHYAAFPIEKCQLEI